MKDIEKMMIFGFLAFIFTIGVLGYHKSGGTPTLASGGTTPTYTSPTNTSNNKYGARL